MADLHLPRESSGTCLIVIPCAASEGQERNMAGAFDGARQFALVFGAYTGLAARANLALVRHIAAQHIDLLVIDPGILICTEGAFAWARKETSASSLVIISRWLIAHLQNSLLVLTQPANLT